MESRFTIPKFEESAHLYHPCLLLPRVPDRLHLDRLKSALSLPHHTDRMSTNIVKELQGVQPIELTELR